MSTYIQNIHRLGHIKVAENFTTPIVIGAFHCPEKDSYFKVLSLTMQDTTDNIVHAKVCGYLVSYVGL